eukprot:8867594-Ditylum_brightwellii.AAC.1
MSTEDLQQQKRTGVNYKFTEDINQSSSNYYKKYCNVTYRIKEQCADMAAKYFIAACIDRTELKKSVFGSMKGNTNLAIDCLTLLEQDRMQIRQKIK